MRNNKKDKKIALILDDYNFKYSQKSIREISSKITGGGGMCYILCQSEISLLRKIDFDAAVIYSSEELLEKVVSLFPDESKKNEFLKKAIFVGKKTELCCNIRLKFFEEEKNLESYLKKHNSSKKIFSLKTISEIEEFESAFESEGEDYIKKITAVMTKNSAFAHRISKAFEKSGKEAPVYWIEEDEKELSQLCDGMLNKILNEKKSSSGYQIYSKNAPLVSVSYKDFCEAESKSLSKSESQAIREKFEEFQNATVGIYEREKYFEIMGEYLPALGIADIRFIFDENDDFEKESESGLYFIKSIALDELHQSEAPAFVASVASPDAFMLESVSENISKVLNCILQSEKIKKERLDAENSLYTRLEYFANIIADLCDPLKDIYLKLDQMKLNIENGMDDREIISEQLLFLESQIQAQLGKTTMLVELSNTQLDNFQLDKVLFDIREILPEKAQFTGTDSAIEKIAGESIPLLSGDTSKLKDAVLLLCRDEISGTEHPVKFQIVPSGISIKIERPKINWNTPKSRLAEKIFMLHFAEIQKSESDCEVVLSWPTISGQSPLQNHEPVPLDSENSSMDEWFKIYSFKDKDDCSRFPLAFTGTYFAGKSLVSALEEKIKEHKTKTIIFCCSKKMNYGAWATEQNSIYVSTQKEIEKIFREFIPGLIVFDRVDESIIKKIRKNQKTVLVPVLVIPDEPVTDEEVEILCKYPKVILCNQGACESKEFTVRIGEVLNGSEILPPHTGALVKKAILYLNERASEQIVRWKLADTVHVSEDYLTRVFHQEIGLSLWEYLNRYRVFLAKRMLLETNSTIYEIAEKIGFQDQAYFCRVFKKIYGIPPGKLRSK